MYVPGKKQAAADAFSRRKSPVQLHSLSVNNEDDMEKKLEFVMLSKLDEVYIVEDFSQEDDNVLRMKITVNNVNTLPSVITWAKLRQTTEKDHKMVKLIEQIEHGFPDSQNDVHSDIKSFIDFVMV